MALALTFCLVARNSHVSAATIRHRAFSGVEKVFQRLGLCCFAWVAQRQYLSTLHAFSGFKGAQTRSALQTKRPPIGPESCRGSAVSHGLPSANTSPLSRFLAGSKVPKRDRLCRPNGHPLGLNPAGAVLFRMGCPAPIPPCFQRLNEIGSADQTATHWA